MSIEEMKAIDISTVDPNELVDVREISLDENLSKEERADKFAVKNVYINNGVSLRERFEQFARTL